MHTGGAGYAAAAAAASEATKLAEPGSRGYCQALYGGIMGALLSNQRGPAKAFMATLLTIEPDEAAFAAFAGAIWAVVATLFLSGQRDTASRYVQRLRTLLHDRHCDNPGALAFEVMVSSTWEIIAERDAWAGLQLSVRARELFEAGGDRANVVLSHVERGDAQAAILAAQDGLADPGLRSNPLRRAWTCVLLGEAHVMLGQFEQAERAFIDAGAGRSGLWMSDVAARGLRARVLLARGQASEAAREADETIAMCQVAGTFDYFRPAASLLTRAEAHHAAGNFELAKQAITEARDELMRRAAKIEDPSYRQSFLERVVVHARTLALAQQWLG